jgi:hypothetical protein
MSIFYLNNKVPRVHGVFLCDYVGGEMKQSVAGGPHPRVERP